MKDAFRVVSVKISRWAGSAYAFISAIFIILIWASSGPLFDYSDTWQLIINTGTTIVTFLMVFLIQNTQNRDGKAMQLKLDELISSTKSARDIFVGLEELTDQELLELDEEFKSLYGKIEPTKPVHKLHRGIMAEYTRRLGLRNAAGHMITSIIEPLEMVRSKAAEAGSAAAVSAATVFAELPKTETAKPTQEAVPKPVSHDSTAKKPVSPPTKPDNDKPTPNQSS
jgi:low affinity Fe/Cu permease